MNDRLMGRISDGVRGIPDVDTKGRWWMGWGVVFCGAIEWEEARGAWEDAKHWEPNGAALEGLVERLS